MANRWFLMLFLAGAGMAATNGSAKMAASLLQVGSSSDSANPDGEAALMAAARTGKVAAIKELLDHGVDVNAKESLRGQTALMGAVLENHLDAAKYLLERGADINTYTRAIPTAKGGMTALLFAAREGYQEMAELLLDRGADIKGSSANRTSPLLIAILNGHVPLAMQLLDRGADPNAADAYGRGPLLAAVEMRSLHPERYTALIHTLVEKGADVNAHTDTVPAHLLGDASCLNVDGLTPFLRAALSGDVDVMRYLLDHGAEPNVGLCAEHPY
jgi:uncharacterized protein